MSTSSLSFSLLGWNVRGLNNADKRALVRESVMSSGVSVVCFQESKLEVVDSAVVFDSCGLDWMNWFPSRKLHSLRVEVYMRIMSLSRV